MADTVLCNGCGIVLEEESSLKPEDRQPCPKCGSTARRFAMVVSAGLSIGEEIQAVVTPFDTASLLVQSVIIPAGKTTEGQLIAAVAVPWFRIIELLRADPSFAYQISDRKWEEIIAGAYRQAGFEEVTLTPHSGDYGRDVIAVKRGLGTVRVIDQVKAYKPGHLVTANDVRALLGVLQGDQASKGFLTTTSDFAPKLRDDILLQPFMPSRLELVNGETLLARLDELAKRP